MVLMRGRRSAHFSPMGALTSCPSEQGAQELGAQSGRPSPRKAGRFGARGRSPPTSVLATDHLLCTGRGSGHGEQSKCLLSRERPWGSGPLPTPPPPVTSRSGLVASPRSPWPLLCPSPPTPHSLQWTPWAQAENQAPHPYPDAWGPYALPLTHPQPRHRPLDSGAPQSPNLFPDSGPLHTPSPCLGHPTFLWAVHSTPAPGLRLPTSVQTQRQRLTCRPCTCGHSRTPFSPSGGRLRLLLCPRAPPPWGPGWVGPRAAGRAGVHGFADEPPCKPSKLCQNIFSVCSAKKP